MNVFEQTTNSVSAGSRSPRRLDEVGSVDVGDEAERHVAAAVVPEGVIRHHGAEVGAADPDVDDVADRRAGEARPLPRANSVRERGHPVEHGVHVRDDIDAVDDERAPARHAQRDVQDRAILGDVDPLAREHRVASLGDPCLGCEIEQEREGLVGDPVLRVVEEEPGRLDREPLGSIGIGGEELAKVASLDCAEVLSSADQASDRSA